MCIRDRTGSQFEKADEVGALEYLRVWVIVEELEIQRILTCLLYTSDAADERSSVDLGGRRIIKKKKKNDNGAHRVHVHKTSEGRVRQQTVYKIRIKKNTHTE